MSGNHRHGSILTVGPGGCLRGKDYGNGHESTVDVIRLLNLVTVVMSCLVLIVASYEFV